MNHKKRKKWPWIITGILFLLIGYPFVFYSSENHHCLECLSTKRVYTKFLFFRFINTSETTITESYFLNNFAKKDHKHKWQYKQGNDWDYFRTYSVCSLGANRSRTTFADKLEPKWYNEHKEEINEPLDFHLFIEELLNEGVITRKDIIQLSLMKHQNNETKKMAEELIDLFYKSDKFFRQ